MYDMLDEHTTPAQVLAIVWEGEDFALTEEATYILPSRGFSQSVASPSAAGRPWCASAEPARG